MIKKIIIWSITLLLSIGLQAADLDSMVGQKDLFSTSAADFSSKFGKTLKGRWTSNLKDSYRTIAPHSIFGKKSLETICNFSKEKLSKITFSIYNRGDTNMMSKTTFDALVEELKGKLNTALKVKGRLQKKNGAAKQDTWHWKIEGKFIRLDFSATKAKRGSRGPKYRTEFITLSYQVSMGKYAPRVESKTAHVRKSQLKHNISRDDNGDVYIKNVPMVDQGQKGYCACATTARILNYYGRDVDQHQVSQIADGSAGGTNPESLYNALKKIRTKMSLSVKELYNIDSRETQKIIRQYNRYAKKAKTNLLPKNAGWNYMQMAKKEMLLTALTEKYSEFEKFKKNIISSVKAGTPLAWGLMLGIYPEGGKTPQSRGGHMRTIIGYNEKTDDLIFSDSWGAGHEKKKMKFNHAFACTMGVYLIQPR